MRAILIDKFVQDYNEIKISEVDSPKPREGEVIVRIKAAGVNFVDLLYARGKHQNNRSLVRPPFILGLEFAGVVIFSSAGSSLKEGDRVFGGHVGSYAEEICVSERTLRRIPNGWDFADAAGFAATAPVSYGALVTRGQLCAGEIVLVHAAAGGLGLMAVQIAKALGARVIATASTSERLDIARRFGADEGVNYSSNPEWWKEVLNLTKGSGADLVFDPVGLVDLSLKCLKHKGRILVIGFAGVEGKLEKIAMNRVLLRQAQIIGYRFGESDRRDPTETAEIWSKVEDLIANRLLRSTAYNVVYNGLESVTAAMNDLNARKVWGKAVIRLDAPQMPRL